MNKFQMLVVFTVGIQIQIRLKIPPYLVLKLIQNWINGKIYYSIFSNSIDLFQALSLDHHAVLLSMQRTKSSLCDFWCITMILKRHRYCYHLILQRHWITFFECKIYFENNINAENKTSSENVWKYYCKQYIIHFISSNDTKNEYLIWKCLCIFVIK